jgi:hypothetical protein
MRCILLMLLQIHFLWPQGRPWSVATKLPQPESFALHAMKNEARLLENFVGKFRSLDEVTDRTEPIVIKQVTNASELDRVYSVLPARFPQLYEELLLNYRWRPVVNLPSSRTHTIPYALTAMPVADKTSTLSFSITKRFYVTQKSERSRQ